MSEQTESTALRVNAAANYLGRGVTALLAFIFVPIYVRYIGVESYGLVGFAATLQSLIGLLGGGISATLSRELARLTAYQESGQEQRDVLRTLELVFVLFSFAGALVMVLLAGLVASWLNPQALSLAEVTSCIRLMALMIAFEFLSSFYQGGLLALQRQVFQNAVRVGFAVVRNVGVIAPLAWVSPTVTTYLEWQVGVALVQGVVSAIILWRLIPPGVRPARFKRSILLDTWKFALGMVGVNVTVLLLFQADKVVLSKLLTLQDFGYYTLAATIPGGLCLLVYPLSHAIFPQLCKLVERRDEAAIGDLYHKGGQAISLLVIPFAATLILFSPQVLQVWTADPVIVLKTWPIVSILAAGALLNCLMYLPYVLMLAHGWTRLNFIANLACAIVLIPTMIAFGARWGGIGAAFIWLIWNLSYLVSVAPLLHRRILRGHLRRWCTDDVIFPIAAAGGAAATWLCITHYLAQIPPIFCIGGAWMVATSSLLVTLPMARRMATDTLTRGLRHRPEVRTRSLDRRT